MEEDLRAQLRRAARAADPSARLAAVAAQHRSPQAILRALASLQDGQFATRQARAVGLSANASRWLVTAGHVVRLQPGVARFTVTPGTPDPAVTAWLTCWPVGTISHRSAARHHGLVVAGSSEALPEVTVPHRLSRHPTGVRVHASRCLSSQDRHWVEAVAYTSLARTVCDLACRTEAAATLRLVDEAVATGASRRWLHARAADLADGRSGVTLVRDATATGAAPEFRSWLERRCASVLAAAGVPAPRWNVPVRDARGRIGIVDALWADQGVVVELEGLRFHTTPSQRRRDARRFNRLLEAGFTVRRFTWQDVVERPGETTSSLLLALRSSR